MQLCTHDHLLLLQRAGFELEIVGFDTTYTIVTRALNRLDGRGYRRMIPSDLSQAVVNAVERKRARFVFLNEADFTFLAIHLRKKLGDTVKLIHLSHGLHSTDMLILQQIQRTQKGTSEFDGRVAKALGAKLQFEADYRRVLDAAVCISPLDMELERWLGVNQVQWFSRLIREPMLVSSPIDRRVGCVSTLDHIPNRDGLTRLFESIEREGIGEIRIRLVGRPKKVGQEFASRFNFVEYLGILGSEDLRTEAASWCCFVHPIFHYARGCSTKIAVALGWGIPIVTTHEGVRGYVWNEQILRLAANSKQLTEMLSTQMLRKNFAESQQNTRSIAEMQPSIEDLSGRLATFLTSV